MHILDYYSYTQRNTLTAESDLEIIAPSITFTGNLENVYTKAECDEKFSGGGGGTTDYNSLSNRPIIDGLLQSNLDLNNNSLLNNGKQLYCPTVTDNIVTFDKDIQADKIKIKVDENKYLNIADDFMTRESLRLLGIPSYLGAMADYAYMMFHSCNGIYLARNFLIAFSGVANPNLLSIEWVNEYGNPYNTTNLINIYKDRIESKINASFPNIYTKEEVDQKIAEAGGGGGTVPDPLNVNKLTASIVHADSELQALNCNITGHYST